MRKIQLQKILPEVLRILRYKKVDSGAEEKMSELSFSESLIIKKNQDNFEQNDYEKITIENLSELLINKVILYLARSS